MQYSNRKLEAHIKAAYTYAALSYATKRKVGAVLIKDNRIVSIGYNGTPAGCDNNCEYLDNGKLKTSPEVIHAEENVILFAAKDGIATDGCIMVITHSPCIKCARSMYQCGIKEVIYNEKTKHDDAIKFLENNNVKVKQYNMEVL